MAVHNAMKQDMFGFSIEDVWHISS